ncbi:MAG: polyphosphate:AMP phosphotransferase [Sandaracinaceae bacterium]|nr:polyphosphate:AMP phosphotransferase [Sandaracinaceae bacterium]
MFESAEIGHEVSKEDYDKQVPELRTALLNAQYELLEKQNVAVVVVVGGVDGAGKGDTINQLNAWLDARHVRTHGMGPPTDEEAARPPYWRFWRLLPPKGKIGVFMGSWYTAPIVDRVFKRIGDADLDSAMDRCRHFERMLSDEGVIVLKLWFHLSKEEQRERLKRLEKDKRTRWRVTETDWKHFAIYDKFRRISARALRQSSTEYGPWLVVSGRDRRYRELTVGRALLEAIQRGLARDKTALPPPPVPQTAPPVDGKTILDTLDLQATVDKDVYDTRLELLQGKLNLMTRSPEFAGRSTLIVFEGSDAAGKGGAIRRVTAALDARQYAVVPIAAPTDEERAQPYLWRFWRHLPSRGKMLIFDRSWYGRVLVERVEGFAPPSDWMRAYTEINDFEEQLVEHGLILIKLWLQVDAEEQLRRFKEREQTGFKQYKITAEDWRNREKWTAYKSAANDMVERTSTEIAPWTLVPANDKRHARIQVLETVVGAIEKAL